MNFLSRFWHAEPIQVEELDLVAALHAANFQLWHFEDEARDPLASDEQIASSKRSIDKVNQRRNDLAELIDATLLENLGHHDQPGIPLHSETPGQMLDRLSILSLKLFHTAEETHREDASEAHRERNRTRLNVLREQQNDLAGCLAELWAQVMRWQRRFKRYHQYKMYNDPELNPVLYRGKQTRPAD